MKSVALKFPAITHLLTKPPLFSRSNYPLDKIMTSSSSSKPITDFFPPSKRAKKTTIGACTSGDGIKKKEEEEDVGSCLSEKQKVRAEFNKSLAKAKLNLRVCKERLMKCEIFILYHGFCLISTSYYQGAVCLAYGLFGFGLVFHKLTF